MDQGNLLRHYADIDRVTPQVSIAVKPKPVVETTDQRDVTLEPEIGPDDCRSRSISGVRVEPPGTE